MKNKAGHRWQGINALIAVNLLITFAGAIAAFVLNGAVRDLEQKKIAGARANVELMNGYQKALYDLWKQIPRSSLHELPQNPTDLYSFIEQCHRHNGIDVIKRENLKYNPPRRENDEYTYTIQFKQLRREPIVRFLVDIERGRSYLRTRDLQITFSPQDPNEITSAQITLAYSGPKSESKPK